MRKRVLSMVLIMTAAIFLTFCSFRQPDPCLNYPGLTWGMTPEEVLEVLEIPEENIADIDTSSRSESYRIRDMEMFGEEIDQMVLNFIDMTYTEDFPYGGEEGADCGLVDIRIFYRVDTDMERVFRKIKSIYGENVPEVYEYATNVMDFKSLREEPTEESDIVKLWAGQKLAEVIPDELSEQYRDMWKPYKTGLNDENWERFRENGTLVTVTWVNNQEEEWNCVYLDGFHYEVYRELKRHIE